MSELSKEALGTASIERDTVTTHRHNISMIKYPLAARADNSGGVGKTFLSSSNAQKSMLRINQWIDLFFSNLSLPGYLMHSSK